MCHHIAILILGLWYDNSVSYQLRISQVRPDASALLPGVKRRMFFLMVYGVVPDEPYTILKITQESTTQEVILVLTYVYCDISQYYTFLLHRDLSG